MKPQLVNEGSIPKNYKIDNKLIFLDELISTFKNMMPKSINLKLSTFDETTRIHDWRNHIPAEIKEVWSKLSMEAKLSCAIMAQIEAKNEENDL